MKNYFVLMVDNTGPSRSIMVCGNTSAEAWNKAQEIREAHERQTYQKQVITEFRKVDND